MVASARRVYAKYLKGGGAALVGVPPVLKAEVKAALGGFGARSRVTGGVFRRCGAYVHYRISHTWFREVVGSYVWVDMDYSNDVPAARFVADEFAAAHIADVDLAVPPSVDDVIYNDALVRSFLATLPPVLAAEVRPFVAAADNFMRGGHGGGAPGTSSTDEDADHFHNNNDNNDDDEDDEDEEEEDEEEEDGEEEERGKDKDKEGKKEENNKSAEGERQGDAAATELRFRRVLELLAPMILLFPQTKGFYRAAQARLEAGGGARAARTAFQYARNAVLGELLRRHYGAWAADAAHWRSLAWTPRAVCCYAPGASLGAFAAYTSARAPQSDQLFFYDTVVSTSVVLAPHRAAPAGSTPTAALPSPPASATASRASSPTAAVAATPVGAGPKPLHALGKSRSFHHSLRNMLLRRPSAPDVGGTTSASVGHAHHASLSQNPLQGCALSSAGAASVRRTARHSLGNMGAADAPAQLISEGGTSAVATRVGSTTFAAASSTTGTATGTTTISGPTLAQVLSSDFLRQVFEDTVLLEGLAASAPAGDLRLWTRLDGFFWQHHAASDRELFRRRAELAAAATAILDDHAERAAALLAAAHSRDTVPALRAYLATPGALVTAAFFRPLEVALCEPHFARFRAQLHVRVGP